MLRCSGMSAAPIPTCTSAPSKPAASPKDIPTNHNPRFAPVLRPTIGTGVEALTVAALHYIANQSPKSART